MAAFLEDVKAHRPHNEGIREWDPRPKPNGPVMLTERASSSLRTVRGWLFPLEHYDDSMRLNVVSQYLELLLVMASNRPVDVKSMRSVLRQARDSLDDEQYERLLGYRPMFDWNRGVTSA